MPSRASGMAPSRRVARSVLTILVVLLIAVALLALSHGAYRIASVDVLRILADTLPGVAIDVDAQQAAVLAQIRAPRVVLAALTGAGLAVAGALMQGLFRNPLADPSLIGVSAGAALAAATVIVLGAALAPGAVSAGSWAAAFALPGAAFVGSLAVTALVYRIGHAQGLLSLPVTLLAGIAVNAMAMAGVGLLTYVASDEQLRTLTFWNLGSLAGAQWTALAVVGPLVLATLAAAAGLARPLNALAMGEARAGHLGVDVARSKRQVIVLAALATGALVAMTGVIGFIGLVAPHLVRLLCGPDHRVVLPAAALLGAVLVLLADLAARTVVAPAELPIGILTAALGAPFFLALLLRRRTAGSL
ncbi:MAG: iron ABC transporter permease [Burkholderiaceae bacterium]|nr:iron ABC transporter permease [Burkholderiaceae bacterium]